MVWKKCLPNKRDYELDPTNNLKFSSLSNLILEKYTLPHYILFLPVFCKHGYDLGHKKFAPSENPERDMTSTQEGTANLSDRFLRALDDFQMVVDYIKSVEGGKRILAELYQEEEASELIEALDTIKISLLHIDSVPSCAICLTEFIVGKDACQMFCHSSHIFHHDCLRRWLEMKKECPLCKTPVPYPYQRTI